MSISYTLRLPDNLKSLMDLAARSGGISTAQFVIDACWKYLERGAVAQSAEHPPRKRTVEGSIPSGTSKPTIDDLRAICAGNNPPHQAEQDETEVKAGPTCSVDICGKPLVGKTYRGVTKWACVDESCSMYGREQRGKR